MKKYILFFITIGPWLTLRATEFKVECSWIKSGRIVFIPTAIGRVGANVYYFTSDRELPISLNGSVAGLQALVARQSFDSGEMKGFLERHLPKLSLLILGEGELIDGRLEADYIWNHEHKMVSQPYREPITKEIVSKIQELRSKLRVTVSSDAWDAQYYVLARNGSVERWAMRGKLRPFIIESFSREPDVLTGIVPKLLRF